MKILNEIKTKIKYHTIWVFLFLFICAYSFFIVSNGHTWNVSRITYMFHTVDYSMGFCSTILPGAISNLLIKNLNTTSVTVLETIFILLFFAILSYLLEKLLLAVPSQNRHFYFLLAFFFLTGPCSFPIFVYELGMLDSYWLYFTILAFFFIKNKKTYIFLIPVGLACVLVHFSSVIAYVPCIALLILYKITLCDKKSEQFYLWSVLIVYLCVSYGLAFYFIMFQRNNTTYSMEEFNAIIKSRGTDFFGYYDYNLYGFLDTTTEDFTHIPEKISLISESAPPVIKFFLQQLLTRYDLLLSSLFKNSISYYNAGISLLLIFPILSYLFKFFIEQIQKSDGILRRIIFFSCILLFFLTLFGGLFFSTDIVRWLAHAYIPLFAFFFYCNYQEKTSPPFKILDAFQRTPKILILIYCVFYSFSIYEPYA